MSELEKFYHWNGQTDYKRIISVQQLVLQDQYNEFKLVESSDKYSDLNTSSCEGCGGGNCESNCAQCR